MRSNLIIPWPPHVGDRVGIKGSRLLGTIERVEGHGTTEQFVLSMFAPVNTDAGTAFELAQAAKVARTTYALDELEPHT